MGMELQQSLQIPGTPRSYYEAQTHPWTPPVPPPPWMAQEHESTWEGLIDKTNSKRGLQDTLTGESLPSGGKFHDQERSHTDLAYKRGSEAGATPRGVVKGTIIMQQATSSNPGIKGIDQQNP